MAKPIATYQKLRGGYYTPASISDFLARWSIRSRNDHVLEPSCGDGAIIESSVRALRDFDAERIAEQLHGIEIDELEARKCIDRLNRLGINATSSTILSTDFFTHCLLHLSDNRRFDAIIGNPPFVRYQNFPEEQRMPAFRLMQRVGLKPSRLTNAWVPFIVASSLLLNPKGRLAMVVPAEILQVNYAAELRLFLSEYFQRITLVTFRQLIFEGVQQEVVLLLAERKSKTKQGIQTVEVDNETDLKNLLTVHPVEDYETKPLDHSKEKWTQYFLDRKEIELLRRIRRHGELSRSGEIIDVDVGIVTGQNSFFVLNDSQLDENNLHRYSRRIVSRSAHLRGIIFSEEDWEANNSQNFPTHLLDFSTATAKEGKLPPNVKVYVEKGELAEANAGYKCRIRNPWYVVPSPWVPDAFMLRQIHAYPKIIANSAGATCTDTIHRVRLRNGLKKEAVATLFLNSATFAFSEVIGRSYGGGVLELEPTEAENLPLPLKGYSEIDLTEIHSLILDGKIGKVLDITDQVLLRKNAGLSQQDINNLRRIWEKLRDRRLNRNRARASV